jgi:type II secretory pathway pseudopilin PulG
MLVVLALISFMTALVAPRLQNTLDAVTRSGDRAEVGRLIEELPLRARSEAREIRVAPKTNLSSVINLPEGWSASTITALRIRDNGVCDSARLLVQGAGAVEEWSLAMPDCRVSHDK